MAEIKAKVEEIKRQQSRLMQAVSLHREVLFQYGVEYQARLASIDEIVQDTQSITIINYLNV
jgi:F0F1-type ATP synthase delta subunit